MSYQCILTETKGRVARITLNRPKQLNALSPTLMQELGPPCWASMPMTASAPSSSPATRRPLRPARTLAP